MSTSTASSNTFSSNNNYILNSGGSNVTGLTVTISVTQSLVCNNGFSFQLNAYPPTDPESVSTWQQYGFSVVANTVPPTINAWYDLWVGSVGSGKDIVYSSPFQITLPSGTAANTLPENYDLTITLQYDTNDNVTGVVYTITQGGTAVESQTLTFTVDGGWTGTPSTATTITTTDLSPIVAFELNIVGQYGGKAVTFSSGEGNIIYTATSNLTVAATLPSYALDQTAKTGETSNMEYGSLTVAGNPSPSIQQTFSIPLST